MINVIAETIHPESGNILPIKIPYDITLFPDGTKKFKFNIVDLLHTQEMIITYYYNSPGDIFDLITIIDTIKSIRSDLNITLMIMYYPYGRMDRIEEDGETFTLKTYSKLINQLDISNILVFDPHSPITRLLLNKTSVIEQKIMNTLLKNIIKTHLETLFTKQEKFYIAFPDLGSLKKYSKIIKEIGINERIQGVFVGDKTRNWVSGEVENLVINLKSGEWEKDSEEVQNIVIFDDIITTGQSIICLINKLKESYSNKSNDINFYIYASHLEPKMYECDLLKLKKENSEDLVVKRIMTTSSLNDHYRYFEKDFDKEEIQKYKEMIYSIEIFESFIYFQNKQRQQNVLRAQETPEEPKSNIIL